MKSKLMKFFKVIILLLILTFAFVILHDIYVASYNKNSLTYNSKLYTNKADIIELSNVENYLGSDILKFSSLDEYKKYFENIKFNVINNNISDNENTLSELDFLINLEQAKDIFDSNMCLSIAVINDNRSIDLNKLSNNKVGYYTQESGLNLNIALESIYSNIYAYASHYLVLIPINKESISKNITVELDTKYKTLKTSFLDEIDFNNDKMLLKKPIIYFYPETETKVTVKLSNPYLLLYTYPKYINNWTILAKPSGDIKDLKTNKNYYALYWEAIDNFKIDKTKGFVVRGEDTTNFLEEKLKILGLNDRESNEFIIYWLPELEKNKYNYIRFRTMNEINDYMQLDISPKPDTLIRVIMDYMPLNKSISVVKQNLNSVNRKGFTVVEWGARKLV
ncbi:MAG: hypothetical protein N2749_03445 [Clostridia bacterium]|nr:hypothetical protein [Clostridia bacterium]